MSKLDELIQQLCPDGVEYKKLDQISENLDNERKAVTAGSRRIGEYPYYGASGIVDYVENYILHALKGKFQTDFLNDLLREWTISIPYEYAHHAILPEPPALSIHQIKQHKRYSMLL